ncbi:MAG: hypothetical protein P3W94_000435 [Paracoccus sp. (in: a-proteobacteria)]|nr:hypothetical protein [Paracoccus sp. (in: a-proteobacteria)]
MRRLARLALLSWSVFLMVATFWALSQHPFATPLVDRSLDELRFVLAQEMAREATPERITSEIGKALDAGDLRLLDMLAGLARDQQIVLPAAVQARLDEALARKGLLADVGDCARCIGDVQTCPRLSLIALCTLPFEMSPAGDVAALWRQGKAVATGAETDEIEAGLAALGLAATAGALVSAGATAPVKAGATALRVAHRADGLGPGMRRALASAARGPDPTAALATIGADVGRIARHSPVSDVVPLLRHADSPAELARLARLSEATGPQATRVLHILGKPRTLRLMHRVADFALLAASLIGLVLGLLVSALGSFLSMKLRRILRPRSPADGQKSNMPAQRVLPLTGQSRLSGGRNRADFHGLRGGS